MMGRLLLRGMLVGALAGLLCFGFLKTFGEPQVDRAMAFETRMDELKAEGAADEAMAKGMPMRPAENTEEIVSRATQAGLGLLTGVTVYCTAFGGLFALAFALIYGRLGAFGPRATAALMAGAGFVAISLVPSLKYPASPSSVGGPDTIGMRTAIYFAMIAMSVAAMIAAAMLRGRLLPRLGPWNAVLVAAGAYLGAMAIAALVLPAVNEVPEAFPAVVLWQFRVASLGAQAFMWATLGLGFGMLADRVTSARGPSRLRTV